MVSSIVNDKIVLFDSADGTPTGTTTPSQSEFETNDNKGELQISQRSRTGASRIRYNLVSYPGQSLSAGCYSSEEMQSAHFPVEWICLRT